MIGSELKPQAINPLSRLTGVAVLAVVLTLAGCSKHQPPKSDQAITEEFPTSWAKNTMTVFTTAGIKTTEIFSDSVVSFAEKDSMQAYRVRVNFYDNSGEWMSELTADSGVIRERTEYLEVFGTVRIATRDSAHLATEQLAWDPAKSKIVTDAFVTITKGGDIISGYGMESDSDLKEIVLKRQIKGEMRDYEQVFDST